MYFGSIYRIEWNFSHAISSLSAVLENLSTEWKETATYPTQFTMPSAFFKPSSQYSYCSHEVDVSLWKFRWSPSPIQNSFPFSTESTLKVLNRYHFAGPCIAWVIITNIFIIESKSIIDSISSDIQEHIFKHKLNKSLHIQTKIVSVVSFPMQFISNVQGNECQNQCFATHATFSILLWIDAIYAWKLNNTVV